MHAGFFFKYTFTGLLTQFLFLVFHILASSGTSFIYFLPDKFYNGRFKTPGSVNYLLCCFFHDKLNRTQCDIGHWSVLFPYLSGDCAIIPLILWQGNAQGCIILLIQIMLRFCLLMSCSVHSLIVTIPKILLSFVSLKHGLEPKVGSNASGW